MLRSSSMFRVCWLALFLLASAPAAVARTQAAHVSSPQPVYLYPHRTARHVGYSEPEVFQLVVRTIQDFLSANRVQALTEPNPAAVEWPLSDLQERARTSGAAYLLYVVVDRPVWRPVKVTVECYDTAGPLVWREQAADTGGFNGSTDKAVRRTLEKLVGQLMQRLGQPGLPQATPAPLPPPGEAEARPAPAGARDDSGATIAIVAGTAVRLMLIDSISSKTARVGSAVSLRVLDAVKVGDLVVIDEKAPATATIEGVKPAGRAWHAGTLLLRLNTVTLVNQQQHPLRGWKDAKGDPTNADHDWGVLIAGTYGLALLALPFAPLEHGNQAILPAGTLVGAVVDGDVLLPRSVVESAQRTPAEPRHGPPSVTFYYPELKGGPTESVWCGEIKVGTLKSGGRFTLTLPPARYWLRISKKGAATGLDVEDASEAYYVRVTWQGLGVMHQEVGEVQSAETSPAKSRDVVDVASLDLRRLPSDGVGKRRK